MDFHAVNKKKFSVIIIDKLLKKLFEFQTM